MSMLKVNNLEVAYGGIQAVKGIDLTIEKGELVTLIGANGAGKTSTLRTLVGMEKKSGGSIVYDGQDTSGVPVYDFVRRGLVMIPEGRGVFAKLTVEENLRMGLARFKGRQGRVLPDSVFEMFPVLYEMRHRRGGDLSGGQQQQLAIGRALVSRPSLLILDEPTEGIQPSIIKEIGNVIRQLASRGDMAILLVEQYYDFAEALADRYVVMSRGEVVRRGHGHAMAGDRVRELLAI